MIKALRTISDFVTKNWLVLFFVLTLIAVIMFIFIVISCIRTIRSSSDIPNERAAAENEYFLARELERKENLHNANESKDTIRSDKIDYSDLF